MAEFNLNKALSAISSRVTDEQRVEQDELNRQGRARVAANSMENRISLAKAQEKGVLDQIKLLENLPDSFTKSSRMDNSLDRLGELYAEQGLYEQAIEVTPSPERRDRYQMILNAIETPDGDTCECPPEQFVDRRKNAHIRQPAMQNLGQFVSLKHGRLVNLKVCRYCGFAEAN